MRAQFFYCSSLPIDDPLSPVPPPQTGAAKASRLPPRPFSIHDNRALEEAWLKIHEEVGEDESELIDGGPLPSAPVEDTQNIYNEENVTAQEKPDEPRRRSSEAEPSDPAPARGVAIEETPSDQIEKPTINVAIEADPDRGQSRANTLSLRHTASARSRGPDEALWEDPNRVAFDEAVPVQAQEIRKEEAESGLKKVKSRSRSPFRWRKKTDKTQVTTEKSSETEQTIPYRRLSRSTQRTQDNLELGSSPAERDTTGTPFLRAPSRTGRGRSSQRSLDPSATSVPAMNTDGAAMADSSASESNLVQSAQEPAEHLMSDTTEAAQQTSFSKPKSVRETKVVTGLSRLHVVEMPSLKVMILPIDDVELD